MIIYYWYFIGEYNKGNIITNILVEVVDNGEEDWIGDDYNGEPFWNEKWELKLDSQNCISIREQKDSWSRKEIIELFDKLYHTCAIDPSINKKDYDQWIEKNL